jgi:hypothetical protein
MPGSERAGNRGHAQGTSSSIIRELRRNALRHDRGGHAMVRLDKDITDLIFIEG